MLILKSDSIQLLPEQKVIKAADYAAYLYATQLIRQAEEEAAKIREKAMAAYEAEKRRGYEDGLNEGKEQMAEKMIDTVSEAVNYFSGLEQKVVDLLVQSLRRIVGEMDANDLMFRVVRNALEVARTQKQVVLRVCPVQVDPLRERLNEILALFPSINFIDITPDPRLREGGCILETEMGVVDASVEIQLEAIRRSLQKATNHS